MTSIIGQTIDHYKILEKLGEGGMGVVYKAEDLRLTRTVALKFLPQGLDANEPERARFLQEARAAAILNHPNICTIHDIQEYEGQPFIVMECVEGKTLRDAGPIDTVQQATAYGIQIAEALQEAHARGIVHRDIKSENIMVNSKNQVKVMDFGLAKLKGSLKLTKTSSTIGTVAYMAPEQIQGGDVDARSDIFSLGCLLYQMYTGQLPFRGEHEAAMMYSIVNEQPPPMTGLRPEIPAELDRIVRRSLEKTPGDRYQHAGDLARELHDVLDRTGSAGSGEKRAPGYSSRAGRPIWRSRRVWIGAAAIVVLGVGGIVLLKLTGPTGAGSFGGKKMLAVLPFENLGSPDQEYFADGITDEITSRLSGLSGLGVIARSSAMQYKKTTKSLKQIGQDLAVSYVLQGTVRWEGSGAETHVRVTPQLIAVGDETQIWSEPFESVLSGAFKLQKEIAGNVASALNITLLQPERNSLEAALTTNSEAYDNYLRAVSLTNRSFGEKDFRMAEQFLTKAVDLDSLFAAAHAKLSVVHSDMYWEFYDRTDQRVQRAKEAAEKALRLNPTLALAHVAMGVYYYHCRLEYENALKEFELALALQPNYPTAWLSVAAVKRRQGKFEEAAEDFEKVVAADPRSGGFFAELSITYLKLRKFPEAARSIERSIELSSEWPEPYALKALLLLRWTGDVARARAALEEGARKGIRSQDVIMTYAGVTIDIADGHYEDALRRLARMDPDRIDRQEFYIPADLLKARIYGYMKQPQRERQAYESARVMLEKASREHPEDSRLHGALGVDYAGLGRKDDALREGRLAVEQLPIAGEGVRGPYRAEELALTYVMTGEYDEAVTILEQLLSVPSDVNARGIRLNPAWAPLHGNPRFERLMANAP